MTICRHDRLVSTPDHAVLCKPVGKPAPRGGALSRHTAAPGRPRPAGPAAGRCRPLAGNAARATSGLTAGVLHVDRADTPCCCT